MYYHYDPVQVYGYGDGSFDGFKSAYLDGPGLCQVLLHPFYYRSSRLEVLPAPMTVDDRRVTSFFGASLHRPAVAC